MRIIIPIAKYYLFQVHAFIFGIAFFMAEAQVSVPSDLHECSLHCSHARIMSPHTGIYPQDQRVHNYDVKFYGIDLKVNPSNAFIEGSLRLVAEIVKENTRLIVMELTSNMTVSQVVYNGQQVPYTSGPNIIVIDLGIDLPARALIDLDVYYSGLPELQGFFSGLQSRTNSFGENVLWTLSEPHNARQWFPCKQVLEDKADSAYIFITTPPGYVGASNGLLTHVEELPDQYLRYEWKTYYPIAYYLLSMAVANYQQYNFHAPQYNSSDSIFIQNFIYNHPQVLQNERENLHRTRDFMYHFTRVWGAYPFATEKYGHAQAPMGGGMEHQTISTMGYFGFDITAHELAHHWFGNYVTCATWSDIWINEGFASYGEYLSREFILGRESADRWMQSAHEIVRSAPGGSVYVPPFELADVWRIFNGRLSYKKGAAIIHLLRFEINDDPLFFRVMEEFMERFANSTASGDDFRKSLDTTTGQSWEWFFDQWYYGEGFPNYLIEWKQQNGKLILQSSQTTSAGLPSFFKGSIEFLIKTQNHEHFFRFFQDQPLQIFEVDLDDNITEIIFDPGNFMLKSYLIVDSSSLNLPGEKTIWVSPNPFHEHFMINYTSAWFNAKYRIADLQGRIILEGILDDESKRVYLQGETQGVYFITFTSKSGYKETIKLMKSF
jgi:aminopeptidase N